MNFENIDEVLNKLSQTKESLPSTLDYNRQVRGAYNALGQNII